MLKKYDILYILVIPINLFYHFSYRYLYEKNKKINDFIRNDRIQQ